MNCLGLLVVGAVCEEKAEAWASPASPREKRGWAQDLSGGKTGKRERKFERSLVFGVKQSPSALGHHPVRFLKFPLWLSVPPPPPPRPASAQLVLSRCTLNSASHGFRSVSAGGLFRAPRVRPGGPCQRLQHSGGARVQGHLQLRL